MKVLLVEDDDIKSVRVANALVLAVPGVQIVNARSLRGAEAELEQYPFDLLVLDMSMPNFDVGTEEQGGRPQALGGEELLQFMRHYKLETPTVVVTQFNEFGSGRDRLTLSELNRRLRGEHGAWYLGSVYYDTSSDVWIEDLIGILKSVVVAE